MFTISKRLIGDVEPILYKKPTAEETFLLGEALTETAGAVTKATATVKPRYICAGVCNDAGLLPVIPVLPTTQFLTEAAVTIAESLVGSAVTLSADGGSVTATTTGGVFTVDHTDGATKSVVTGHFN